MTEWMKRESGLALVWAGLIFTATLTGTLVLACMMPFVAIAAACALSMPRRAAVLTLLACWLGNQALGFGLMGFPRDPATLVAGISLLAASLAALFAARAVPRPLGDAKAAVNFALAFVTFEIGLLAYALAFGDPAMFAPEIVGAIGLNEAVWFAFLWAGWQLLGRIVPSAHADPAAGTQA